MYYAKMGSGFVDELYIGGRAVSEMYYGEHQVWPMDSGYLTFSGVTTQTLITISGFSSIFVQRVDWGSSIESVALGITEISHTYSMGENVTISFPTSFFLGSLDIEGVEIHSIDSWGEVNFTPGMFSGQVWWATSAPDTWLPFYKTTTGKEVLSGAKNLTTIPDSWVGLGNITDANRMFSYTGNLNIPNDWHNLDNLLDATAMFLDSDLESIPDSWDGLNNLYVGTWMFRSCSKLQSIPDSWVGLDKLKNATLMFGGNESLIAIPDSWVGLENLESACRLFEGCSSLRSAPDSWVGLENVESIIYMFKMCYRLSTIPTSGFEALSKVIQTTGMFEGCSSITCDIYPLYLYLSTKATPVVDHDGTFYGCTNATNYDLLPSDWK